MVLFLTPFNHSSFAHYQQAKLSAPDANTDDRFGISVAIDGSTAVVGAYQADSIGLNSGAAYVFELIDSNWVQQQKLTASDGAPGDQFGRSVAIEANTIIVGAYLDDTNDPNTGSAYVFYRSGSVWTQYQKLTAPDAGAGDNFGGSVAISSDTIVIGAYGNDNYTGCAYVFTRVGPTWTFQQKLTASDASELDYFGYSAAIDANTLIVGAYNDDHPGHPDAGSAYVFQRQDQTWIQSAILRASDAGFGDHFGFSVALDGNCAVIGAYECEINGVSDAGAAYVFTMSDAGWTQQQKLFDDDPGPGEDFGRSVAIEKNVIFAGCVNDSLDGLQTGSVFEFLRNDSTWFQQHCLTARDANAEDNFGFSVSVSGRHLIVGAPYSDPNGLSSGSAYIFDDILAADLDGDSDVDFADFAVFATAWLTSPAQPAYNLACDLAIPPDCFIDVLDLQILCHSWLAGK